MTEAVFIEEAPGRLVPSPHARSPWDAGQMHGGAPAGLCVRAVERLQTPVPMRVVRLTLDFLGVVPLDTLEVAAECVRPGKRVQLAEATVHAGGRIVARARVLRMREGDVPLPDDLPAETAPHGPERAQATQIETGGPDGEAFHTTAMELREEQGPLGRLVWFRLRRPLVQGEDPSPAQRAVCAADFGNGVSAVLDWSRYLFINSDLSVHLHRKPLGEWVALEARTDVEDHGTGAATTILHDEAGRLGTGAQSLFVDRR